MFVPPAAPTAEEFIGTANAEYQRVHAPHSKRLKTTAHSDFWDRPIRFVVDWEQPVSFSSEIDRQQRRDKYVTVTVQLPITKPIAPGSMRIQIVRAVLGNVARADFSTGNNQLERQFLAGSLGTDSSIKLLARGLTEGAHLPSGHSSPWDLFELGPPLEYAVRSDFEPATEIAFFDAFQFQTVDPSHVHHPTFLPNSGHFSFDIYAEGGFQPDINQGTNGAIQRATGTGENGNYKCLAEFVIFPDPYWSRT